MWMRAGVGEGDRAGLPATDAAGFSAGNVLVDRARARVDRPGRRGGDEIRVAFLGQPLYFRGASAEGRSSAWHFRFFDLAPDAASLDEWSGAGELESFDPDVVVLFRPERQPGLVRALRARAFVVGVLTEPMATRPWTTSPDLWQRRRRHLRAGPVGTDALVHALPQYAEAFARSTGLGPFVPLPVHDALFREGPLPTPDPRTGLFVGRVTPRRQRYLAELKHRYAWTVIDHGTQWLDPTPFSIGVNLHAGRFPNLEHRVLCHMANGQVVLDEPTDHPLDLFEGVHRLTFSSPRALLQLVTAIERDPEPAIRVQRRARLAVEKYRASVVWPRVVVDALAMAARR